MHGYIVDLHHSNICVGVCRCAWGLMNAPWCAVAWCAWGLMDAPWCAVAWCAWGLMDAPWCAAMCR